MEQREPETQSEELFSFLGSSPAGQSHILLFNKMAERILHNKRRPEKPRQTSEEHQAILVEITKECAELNKARRSDTNESCIPTRRAEALRSDTVPE